MIALSEFNIPEKGYPSQMCYVNGHIVMTGFTNDTIRVYHEETGSMLQEWNSCHMFPRLMAFEAEGKEYLLEGCTYYTCMAIRGYESPETSSSSKVFYEHMAPDAMMCKGPTGTIFLVEKKSVKQLRYSAGKFHLSGEFSCELEYVNEICYYEKYGIVVVLHEDCKTLTGVILATGQVAWKRTKIQFGSPAKVLDYFKDVLIIPDGRVCIFTLWKLFLLDPKTGTIVCELLDFTSSRCIRKIATRRNGFQQRFAIQHSNHSIDKIQISVFYLLPERCLPLRNIISDEENSNTHE